MILLVLKSVIYDWLLLTLLLLICGLLFSGVSYAKNISEDSPSNEFFIALEKIPDDVIIFSPPPKITAYAPDAEFKRPEEIKEWVPDATFNLPIITDEYSADAKFCFPPTTDE